MAIDNIIPKKDLIYSDKILTQLQYNKISHYRDVKNSQYLSKQVIYNKCTGSISSIEYNKEWHLRQSYIYNTIKIDELNEQSIENGLVPIFITLTLPSEYHPSSKKYNPFISIEDSYKDLLTIFRALYNSFYVDRKKIKGLKFIRVIEPHKSFVPHLHAIIYLPPLHLVDFKKHFINTKKRFELKQIDYKILDTAKYATTYLLKYVQKTLEGDDVIRGWAIHHNINRVFTMSNLNIGINRQIFSKITRYVKFNKESDLNYFRQILLQVGIRKVIKSILGDVIKSQYFGNDKANIFVNFEVVRTKNFEPVITENWDVVCYTYNPDGDSKISVLNTEFDEEYNIEYDIDEMSEENYKYSLDEFTIEVDSSIKYNKKDLFMYNSNYFLQY